MGHISWTIFALACAGMCANAIPNLEKRSADPPPQSPDGEATQEDVGHEGVVKATNYFTKYMQMSEDIQFNTARLGYTSDTGEPIEKSVSITETPSFIESVTEAEYLVGLTPSGRLTNTLVERLDLERCGMPDTEGGDDAPGAYTVKAMWDSKYLPEYDLYPLTFSFIDVDSIPDHLTQSMVEEGILSAMCMWESNSNLRFKNIGNENELADITVSFEAGDHGDWYSFDGTGGTLAHAFYPENGRLHFDRSEKWYLAKAGALDYHKKDIFTVAAHEIGHNIGLMHSKTRGALMFPIYKYMGTFEEYVLPPDDIAGIESMYGPRVDSNPAGESGTACRELHDKYGVASTRLGEVSDTPKTVVMNIPCNDDPKYKGYCPNWKKAGYCTDELHVNTLRRRCKLSCGFCPTKPLKQKPRRGERTAGKLSSSICGIDRFDSVAVVFDAKNYLKIYYFKNDYYFESSVKLETNLNDSYSLLDDSETLGEILQWRTDPKTMTVGSYKYMSSNMFRKSRTLGALLLAKAWYLAFEKETGIVHRYARGTPTTTYMGNFTLKSFPGYPHASVDAGFIEFNVGEDKSTIYSLFHHDKIWQYKDVTLATKRLDQQKLVFEPVEAKQGVGIEEWHGVPACDVDSVIEYKGTPYFLKDNTFWPAVDSQPPIPRDISYNFMRCWEDEPTISMTPPSCNAEAGKQTGDGNGTPGTRLCSLLTSSSVILPLIIVLGTGGLF